jgi:hypothetical protein
MPRFELMFVFRFEIAFALMFEFRFEFAGRLITKNQKSSAPIAIAATVPNIVNATIASVFGRGGG